MRSTATRLPVRQVSSPFSSRSRGGAPLLHRLDRQVMEQLENRIHLSVSRDTNGYTVVTPEAGATVVYVSRDGSDSSGNGTINSPVATVQKALTLVHPQTPGGQGFGDQILLRRGDTFNTQLTNWTYSGQNANNPFVLGAYSDPNKPSSERPKINSGNGTAFSNQATTNNHPAWSNFSFLGVSFEASDRNYRQPTPNFTVGTRSDGQGGTYGMFLLGALNNISIEDCSFQYFRTGLSIQAVSGWGRPQNVTLRRDVIADQYVVSFDAAGHYVTSEGIYAQGIDTVKLEENVFDHNGWMDPAYGNFGAVPSLYNHNAYLNDDSNNVVVTGNIFANASSHGIQARSGGTVTNNLFLNNPIAMSYGFEHEHERPGGVFGEVSGNIVYGGRDISGAARGWGLEIGNLTPKANGGGTVVKNNIYAGYANDGQPAIQVSIPINVTNPQTAVGVNDLTVQNNIVYGWTKGVYINPGFAMGGTGRFAYNNVSFLNNEFQQVNTTPIVSHGPSYTPSVETWRGNRYSIQGSASGSTPYFQTKINGTLTNQTLAQWQSTVEPTASTPSISYPDPQRSPASYNATKGGAATPEAFMNEARQLSSRFYRTAYTAAAVNDYMKAGFAGQRVDSLPPSAQIIAPTINAGGGTSTTITVIWTDDNQVNLSSLDSQDLLVTGPTGSNYSQIATLVSATPNADGSVVTAIYSIPAANGAWSAAANGSYTVSVRSGQVIDNSGNATPSGFLGGFSVIISAAAPTATLVAPDVINPNSPATLTVTYASVNGAIDVSTLGDSDLLISGPNGFQNVPRFVSVLPAGNGSPRVATYVLDAPFGGWTPESNGLYTVNIVAGEVTTTTGTPIGFATLGTFKVDVSVPKGTATGPTLTTTTSANQTVTVTYVDNSGILGTSIGADDIQVTGPGYYADSSSGLTLISKTGAGTPASPMVVKYSIPAPAGGFDENYNGTYFITLLDGQVFGNSGTPANGGVIGTFTVGIDMTGPLAVVTQADVYKPTSASTKLIVINYSDQAGVKISTLGTGDITIDRPDGSTVTPALQSISGSGTSVSATYILNTPGGLDASKNGNYQINLIGGQVSDNLGNFSNAGFPGSFRVAIDNVPPSVTGYASSDVFDAAQDLDIYVTFADDPGVDVDTIDSTDIRVVGPNGYNQPVVLEAVDAPSGSAALATYKLTAPAGGWLVTQNGQYNLVLQPNAVSDLSGNVSTGGVIGMFSVSLSTAVSAEFGTLPAVNGPGLNSITVRFNQKVTGFDASDLTLNRDGSSDLLAGLPGLTVTTTDNMNFVVSGLAPVTNVTGFYILTIVAGGSNIVGELGSPLESNQNVFFQVDADAPSFSFGGAFVTEPGMAPAQFTITYFDNTGVNTNTIGDGDIIVKGPTGNPYSQIATLVSIDDGSIGTPRAATYSVPAPAGGWKIADSGIYQILIRASQVADVFNNVMPAQFVGQLVVNVTTSPPDTTPPTFSMQQGSVTAANGQPATFSVVWSDDVAMNGATIGDGDVVVSGPGNVYNVVATLVSSNSVAGGSIVANYSVPAPAGGWTSAWNGTYGVYARLNEVADAAGNVVPQFAFIGRIIVNVSAGNADLTPPTATITQATPNPRTTPLDTATIVFSEPVSGFDVGDLSLTGAAAIPSDLGSGQTLTTSDNKTFVVSGLAAVTAAAGTYTLTLDASGSGIIDTALNAMTTGASMSWTLSATSTAGPVITGVSPSPIVGSTAKQNLTINGSSFASNATVKLKNVTAGTTFTPTIVSRTATQIVVSNIFGTATSSWNAEVLNGTTSSGKVSFGVIASGALGIAVNSGAIKGKTASLSAINGGTSSSTIFTWSATTLPSGASAPTFSANKTNGAKNTTITFSKAGDYTLKLTAVTGSTTKTATLVVTVNQTLTSVTVSPTSATVRWKQTQQVTASGKDQFGASMTTQPSFAWSIDAGGIGTVSASGLYTAPTGGSGTAKVRATSGALSAVATITVPSFTSAKVNFQPSGAATVSGYIVDSGKTFALQSTQQYGWSTSETAQVFDRAKNSNQLLDTSVGVLSGAKWEIAVPNGTYSVKISIGDASKKTTNTVRIEGTSAYSATVLNANAFSNKTVSVTVSDGRLTIDAGSAASGVTFFNYVEITKTA
jgi:hypothetical protein